MPLGPRDFEIELSEASQLALWSAFNMIDDRLRRERFSGGTDEPFQVSLPPMTKPARDRICLAYREKGWDRVEVVTDPATEYVRLRIWHNVPTPKEDDPYVTP